MNLTFMYHIRSLIDYCDGIHKEGLQQTTKCLRITGVLFEFSTRLNRPVRFEVYDIEMYMSRLQESMY